MTEEKNKALITSRCIGYWEDQLYYWQNQLELSNRNIEVAEKKLSDLYSEIGIDFHKKSK